MGTARRREGLGESVGQAAVREVREQMGLEVQPTGLVGIYSDPGHVIAYADGRCAWSSRSAADEESTEVRFVPASQVDRLAMHRSTRLYLQHFLEHRSTLYLA